MPPTGEDYLDYEKKTRYSSGVKKKDKKDKPKNGNDKKPKNGNGNKNGKGKNGKSKTSKVSAAGDAAGHLSKLLEQETYYRGIH